LVAGLHNGSATYAKAMIEKGFQLVTVQSDLGFLAKEAKNVVRGVKGSADSQTNSPY